MTRWQPNARERLVEAALELFLERGYDEVTVAEIAERAGLTRRTFFRHVPDKREVLFAGGDDLRSLIIGAIAAAPASATPLEAVAAGLAAAEGLFAGERRGFSRKRQTVVSAHADLQERESLKLAAITAAMAEALRARGVADPEATVAAELGGVAFTRAFARWIEPGSEEPFGELARRTLDELRAAAAALA